MKNYILATLLILTITYSYAQPPAPASGFRWVLWDQYSDEFNGAELDQTKWRDRFNGWNGRVPAKFDPSTISLQNGNMQITNKKLAVPDGRYTIGGGAVQSLEKTAHFGYYECKFRASRISMSTTFWMSNAKKSIIGPTKLSGDCANDKWSQELDIVESIGGDFNKPWAPNFRTKMNFNTHYRYVDCNGAPEVFYSAGNNAVEGNGQQADANLAGSESWEDYHTYGCYWKDNKTFDFYVDTNYAGTVIGRTDVVDAPFSEPMGINMVTETYDFAKPYPTDAELADNSINTSYYDWIRSYRLIPIFDPEPNSTGGDNGIINLSNGDFESGNLNDWTGWGGTIREVSNSDAYAGNYSGHIKGAGAHEKVVQLSPNTAYVLSAYVKVVSGGVNLGIKENTAVGTTLESRRLTNASYEKIEISFTTGSETNHKLFLFAPQETDEGFGDNFEIVAVNQTPAPTIAKPAIFTEDFSFTSDPVINPEGDELTISYTYKANLDRELQVHIYNDAGTEVFTQKINALEGYGINTLNINLNTTLPDDNYGIVVDLRPIDGTDSEIIASDTNNTAVLSNPDFDKNDFSVSLYPNPVASIVHLKIKEITGDTSVKIYDLLGKDQLHTVMKGDQMDLDISKLSKGVYFVTFQNGRNLSSVKMIVE